MNALKTLFFAGFLLALAAVAFPSPGRRARVQFFGDLYVPKHVLERAELTPPFDVFAGVRPALQNADLNIVNLEGVLTDSSDPASEDKQYHLKMPGSLAALLKGAGIHVATLANNHALDFGATGLAESLRHLRRHAIKTVGAGANKKEATRAAVLPTAAGSVCLLTFSRTLPESFWARENRPGTSYLSYEETAAAIKDCRARHPFVFVTFHWGEELQETPKQYQRELAQLAIRSGADAVIGHHPHILQSIEFFDGKPIVYSVGNFVFGTVPHSGRQEGMAVTFALEKGGPIASVELTPLVVDNRKVQFQPRLLQAREKDPIARHLPSRHPCMWQKEKRQWTCRLVPMPLIGRR